MKRISMFILSTLIAVAALAAPPRRPQGMEHGPGGPGRGPRQVLEPRQLADLLNLTDAQLEQVKPLRETMRTAVEPLRDQLRANHEQMRDAVEAGNTAQAGTLAVAGYNLRQQIKAAHDAFETQFAGILTAAQKAKWDVYREIAELRRE